VRVARVPRVGVRIALALGTTVVVWASAFAAIRRGLEGYTAQELSVFRLLVASAILAVVAPFRALGLPRREDVPRVLLVGLFGMALYQLLLNSGERTVDAGTASILIATAPIFVSLMARFIGAPPLGVRRWVGILVAFSGSTLIALGAGGGISLRPGAVVVLAAALAQAAYFVIQKPLLDRYSAFAVTSWAMWAGTIMLLPFAGHLPSAVTGAGTAATASVVWLGVGASALGFVTWAYAAARVEVTVASATLYLIPPVAMLIGWAWLGESPSLLAISGGALVLAGVALVQRATVLLARARARTLPEALTPQKALR
jgi:terminal-alkyne amino-acid exporter